MRSTHQWPLPLLPSRLQYAIENLWFLVHFAGSSTCLSSDGHDSAIRPWVIVLKWVGCLASPRNSSACLISNSVLLVAVCSTKISRWSYASFNIAARLSSIIPKNALISLFIPAVLHCFSASTFHLLFSALACLIFLSSFSAICSNSRWNRW